MKSLKEHLKKRHAIACLLATYEKDMGNCTKIIFEKGEDLLLKKSVDSTLNSIAQFYTIDLKELRKQQQNLLNCRYYTPLPLSKNLLFIPIKTRMPLVKKDPSLSYINFHQIESLDKKRPILHLKNKHSIKSLNSLNVVEKRYNQGEISAKLHRKEEGVNLFVEESSMAYYPATKADINTLSRELERLTTLVKSLLLSNED